jgi:hypothetical protein
MSEGPARRGSCRSRGSCRHSGRRFRGNASWQMRNSSVTHLTARERSPSAATRERRAAAAVPTSHQPHELDRRAPERAVAIADRGYGTIGAIDPRVGFDWAPAVDDPQVGAADGALVTDQMCAFGDRAFTPLRPPAARRAGRRPCRSCSRPRPSRVRRRGTGTCRGRCSVERSPPRARPATAARRPRTA